MHDPIESAGALPPKPYPRREKQGQGDEMASAAQMFAGAPADMRTLMFVAVLAIGGFSGGGVLSTVSSGNVQSSVAAISAEIKSLGENIGKMQTTLAELQADARANVRERDRVESRINDVEKRVRELEAQIRGASPVRR
jgi:predicted trehalose synthase